MWGVFISGLVLGLAGSFHCIGMCGPLVLAIPFTKTKSILKNVINYIQYGLGKTLAYILLGVCLAYFGSKAAQLIMQKYVSIIAGVLMLVWVLWHYFFTKEKKNIPLLNKVNQLLHKHVAKQMRASHVFSFLLIGFLNGLLPCGMVYGAIAVSLGLAQVYHAAIFMLGFGISTAISLSLFSFFFHELSIKLRQKMQRMLPYLMLLTAFLLILRGAELGIPYLSPILGENSCGHSCCH